MKKILLTVATITATLTTSAQVYVGVNAGYGFGSPRDILGTENVVGPNGSQKNIYGTLGTGLTFGVTPGFWFGEHVGAELGINYFLGSKTEAGVTTSPLGKTTTTAWSNQLRLSPTVVLKTGGENLGLYAKFGLVMPVAGKTYREDEGNASGPQIYAKSETVGQFSTGFTGALGFDFGVGEKVRFFAEANMVNLRITSNTTSVTELTVDGTDQLGNTPTFGKEINYVDEINSGSNVAGPNVNPGQAEDRLRINRNYSAIFLNIGLRFTF